MIQPREPATARLYHADPTTDAGSAFSAWLAVGVACASIATMLVAMIAVVTLQGDPTIAVAVGQLGLVVVPAIAMRATGCDARALGLVRPKLRFVVAAALVGASAWYLNIRLVELLPFPSTDSRSLAQLVEQPSLGIVLVCVAVVPAICEELLFRGVLVRGLASRFHPWLAVIAAAIAFSLYHVNPIQMIPTLTLGLAFGAITLRGGSALPTMVAHALNNGIAILVVRGELPFAIDADQTGSIDRHPTLALVAAATLTTAGIAIAFVAPAFSRLPRARVMR